MRPDRHHPKSQNLAAVVEIAGSVRHRVRSLLLDGHVPLVIGGDCTITLGVVAAAVDIDRSARLVYFDGDADLSTPATTRSGVLDAMGIAHLLDLEGAAAELAAVCPRRSLLAGRDIALVGFEEADLDTGEVRLLQHAGVHRFPAQQLRRDTSTTARNAAAALKAATSRVVHFDVDAVDSIDCPLAHFPHFNMGVTLDAAVDALTEFCTPVGLAAVVVTEVNPLHDPDRVHLARLVEGLARALGAAPTSYPSP